MALGLGKIASGIGKGASKMGKAMTGQGGKGGGVNTGPSQGMMGRVKKGLGGAAQINAGVPMTMGGRPPMQSPPSPMMPIDQNPNPMPPAPAGMPNIVSGPRNMPFMPGGGMMPGQNTGIVGPQNQPPMGQGPMGNGLMQMYARMLQGRQQQPMM